MQNLGILAAAKKWGREVAALTKADASAAAHEELWAQQKLSSAALYMNRCQLRIKVVQDSGGTAALVSTSQQY